MRKLEADSAALEGAHKGMQEMTEVIRDLVFVRLTLYGTSNSPYVH